MYYIEVYIEVMYYRPIEVTSSSAATAKFAVW